MQRMPVTNVVIGDRSLVDFFQRWVKNQYWLWALKYADLLLFWAICPTKTEQYFPIINIKKFIKDCVDFFQMLIQSVEEGESESAATESEANNLSINNGEIRKRLLDQSSTGKNMSKSSKKLSKIELIAQSLTMLTVG